MKRVIKPVLAILAGMALLFSLTNMVTAAPKEKVLVCHNTGSGVSVEINVSGNAVAAHQAHGDTLGTCDNGGGEPPA